MPSWAHDDVYFCQRETSQTDLMLKMSYSGVAWLIEPSGLQRSHMRLVAMFTQVVIRDPHSFRSLRVKPAASFLTVYARLNRVTVVCRGR
jgi:hypothetical protein